MQPLFLLFFCIFGIGAIAQLVLPLKLGIRNAACKRRLRWYQEDAAARRAMLETLEFSLRIIDCDFTTEDIYKKISSCLTDTALIRIWLVSLEKELNGIAIIGLFNSSELYPGRHENHSLTKYDPLEVLLKRRTDNSLSARSHFPTD